MKYRVVFMALLLQLTMIVRGQAVDCPLDIDLALTTANEICFGIGRNQVCYGNNDVNLMPYDEIEIEFDKPGDLAEVKIIRTLSLSALDADTGQWGIAVMQLLANLDPSQAEDVTVLLFGDVAIKDASNNLDIQIVTATNYSNLRRLPDSQTPVMDSVAPGDIVHITGRIADNSWVRVMNPNTNIMGWVSSDLLKDLDFGELEIVDARDPYFAPMQAFYFQSGTDAVNCNSVPRDGIIIQTPEGLRRVTLWVNEVTIDFLSRSTASIQTEADGSMSINVLEGSAYVSSDSEGYLAVAGSSVNVPQSEDGKPVSISRPTATSTEVINTTPIGILGREIILPQPASNNEIAEVNNFVEDLPTTSDDVPDSIHDVEESGSSSVGVSSGGSNANGCNGNSCNAPGQNNDSCPGNSCNAPGKNKDKKNK